MEFKFDYSNFQLPLNHSADYRLRYNDSDYNCSNFNMDYERRYLKFVSQIRIKVKNCRENTYALCLYMYIYIYISTI
jgi:hypothetical protein